MMRRALAAIGAISSCGTSASAEPRQPTGPWRVDYGTAQCVAMRDYGSGDKPLSLVLKPSPKGGVMRILVIRKGSTAAEQSPVTLRLGGKRLSTSLLSYSDEKNGFRIAAINVPMAEFKAHLDTPSIGIDSGPINTVFGMSNLPALMAELDKCLLDLQDFWNIGDRSKSRVAVPGEPKRPLKELFSSRDYPGIALYAGQEGDVTMTFLVDERGEVADCTVDESSGIPVLDVMSCYVIMNRAHFTPARGADGKPLRSAYTERTVWRIAA